jgi:Ca-activated chloride channel family protein
MARIIPPVRTTLWLLLGALSLFAQQAEQPDLVFRADSNLALIRLYVQNKGDYVRGLRTEDFQLLEDGVPEKIAVFEPPGSQHLPIEVILLFDVSLSVMHSSLLDPFSLKKTILDGLGDQVGISIYAFGAKRKRFAQNTRDMGVLQAALKDLRAFTHGGTLLYQSIRDTARDAAASGGPGTRVMVIFSDGFETSHTSPKEAVEAANDTGIPLYPVVLGHRKLLDRARRGAPPDPIWARQIQRQNQIRAQVLQQEEFARFGPQTGGRSFQPRVANSKMIRQILSELVNQIRSEYVVGYYPVATAEKKKCQVEVKLLAKDKGQVHGGTRTVVR